MSNSQKASPVVDLSVIITAHAEGILAHRTLASVRRAMSKLADLYTSEIIFHVDNPTPATSTYVKEHAKSTLKDVHLFENSFGDLGASRNFAIKKANGRYIATIDADDLMSGNWLKDALDTLEKQLEPTIAHSEVTVEFEGTNSLVIKHGEIDSETDSLLSVYANRWNSVIVAPRALLLEEPYSSNGPGYGYEDWQLNCRLIKRGVHNILIPHTAIFVRRKQTNSEWLRQVQETAVLPANPLLAFDTIRSFKNNPFKKEVPTSQPTSIKALSKKVIKKYPLTYKLAHHVNRVVMRRRIDTKKTIRIPHWLKEESIQLHLIEKQIFPTEHLIEHIPIYDTITEEHKITGGLYKEIVDKLRFDHYDYLIFAPWLIKGGADRYTINYANTIARENTRKRVLVITTLPVASPWSDQLDKNVDFLDFGVLTSGVSQEIKHRLIEHIVENGGVSHIHVINSEFGYEFIRLHEKYIKATDRKIILTAFSQSVDKEGRTFGYSHTHVPFVYDLATLITSDNQAVIDMWQNEYGFNPNKMIVHKQPIPLKTTSPPARPSLRKPIRVLWAARISFEKQPDLVAKIGSILKDSAIIDMYGTVEEGYASSIQNLPLNVTYKGNFDRFFSLPLKDYDVLLYTSLFDGMPHTLLDAAEENIPVIASAVGGIPEFTNDTTGILVHDISNPQAYAEAVTTLVTQPELGNKLAEASYKKLRQEYSPEQYVKNIKDFLNRLDY